MRRLVSLCIAVVAGCTCSPLYATSLAYDFTGTGRVCPGYAALDNPACTTGLSFAGTVALDVNPAGPEGSDSNIEDHFAYDSAGWVTPTFEITWGGGFFASAILPGETSHNSETIIDSVDPTNEIAFSQNASVISYSDNTSSILRINQSTFSVLPRNDLDGYLFSDVTKFPQAIDLTDAYVVLTFGDFFRNIDSVTGELLDWSGFVGNITALSWTPHLTTSVPEPGTLALFGVGFLGVLFGRRRAT